MKHIPLRVCIACGNKFPKRELIRVVRTPEGETVIDEKGKASGRGAYVCANAPCISKAVTKNKLERALKTSITSDIKEHLVDKKP